MAELDSGPVEGLQDSQDFLQQVHLLLGQLDTNLRVGRGHYQVYQVYRGKGEFLKSKMPISYQGFHALELPTVEHMAQSSLGLQHARHAQIFAVPAS